MVGKNETPIIIYQSDCVDLWHLQDITFREPKVNI